MGRGEQREMKKIESKLQRQMVFSRRKRTLFKKAHELADLYEDEVALIIFNNEGKLHEYSSTSSILETLEKYESSQGSCLSLSSKPVVDDIEDEAYQEYLELKARAEVLQRQFRNLQGEDLETLRMEELDQLDNHLEVSLKQVRSQLTQSMLGHLAELQQKEQMLRKANIALKKKKMECIAETALRLSWRAGEQQRQHQMDEDKAEIALPLSWQAEQQRQRQMDEVKAEIALPLSRQAGEQQSQRQMDEVKSEIALPLSWQAGEQQRQRQMDEHEAEIALQLPWQACEQQRQQQVDEDKAEIALQLPWQAGEQQLQAGEQQRQQQMDEDKAEIALQLSWQAGEQQRRREMDVHKAEIALQLSWQADEQLRQQQVDEDKAEIALQWPWQAGEQQWQACEQQWQPGEQQWQQQMGKDNTEIALQLSWQAGEQQRQISYNHHTNAVPSECFFQPLESSPSSQIGNNYLSNTSNILNVTAPAQDMISFFPGWML